jgi:hypothetical protein
MLGWVGGWVCVRGGKEGLVEPYAAFWCGSVGGWGKWGLDGFVVVWVWVGLWEEEG